MALSGIFVIFMIAGDLFNIVLQEPPRDLASLIDAQSVLKTMGVQVDEDSLLTLLAEKQVTVDKAKLQKAARDLGAAEFQVRRDAKAALRAAGESARPFLVGALKSADPEVKVSAKALLDELDRARRARSNADQDFVKKLLAIRALEKMKSTKALPALGRIADGKDIMLRAAARDAVNVIQGKKIQRPSGASTLARVTGFVPSDVGLTFVLDCERGWKEHSVAEYFTMIEKAAGKKLDFPGVGGAAAIKQKLPQAEQGIVMLLGMMGNVRVDSITFLIPENVGGNTGYAAFIFKGLYDPARMERVLAMELKNERKVGDRRIIYDRYGPAAWLVDRNTLILVAGPGREGEHMDAFLKAVDARKGKPMPARAQPAFDFVVKKRARIAGSGAFGESTKNEIRTGLQRQLDRVRQRGGPQGELQVAVLQAFLNAIEPRLYVAHRAQGGNFIITATCADNGAAERFEKALVDVQKLAIPPLKQLLDQQPGMAEMLFGANKDKLKFWDLKRDGDKLTATIDSKLVTGVAMVPFVAMRAPMGHKKERVAPMEHKVERVAPPQAK